MKKLPATLIAGSVLVVADRCASAAATRGDAGTKDHAARHCAMAAARENAAAA